MAGQMFMRVDEVAKELGVSRSYLNSLFPIPNHIIFDCMNTPAGMVPSDRSNGAHRTGKWCRFTA